MGQLSPVMSVSIYLHMWCSIGDQAVSDFCTARVLSCLFFTSQGAVPPTYSVLAKFDCVKARKGSHEVGGLISIISAAAVRE
jgi:hypothetical protein